MASINSLMSFSTQDGPGIRYVIFFNGCNLRCKFCHNPETWFMQDDNMSVSELVEKIKKCIPYFGESGGVTYSGGEPLLHGDFLIELSRELKKENINIVLDTAGYGIGNYENILKDIDIVMYDIKDIDDIRYKNLTGGNINKTKEFLEVVRTLNKKVIIRQVIVPNIHNNIEFITKLSEYIKENFILENIIKIEFLPYHRLGIEKYEKLGIKYPMGDTSDMDIDKCNELYNKLLEIMNKN